MSPAAVEVQRESPGGVSTAADSPSEDELFEVLANRRRRYALHALSHGESAELGALAEQVAAWENETSITEVTSTERKRVYTALQQSHLPKMDDAGVVEFDKRAGTVTPSPVLDDVDIYLEVIRGREIPWSEYYLGLAGMSLALLVAVGLHVYPFYRLSNFAWAVFIVTVFTVSATVHYWYTRKMNLVGNEPPELTDE